MTEHELLAFISRILASGNEKNIRYSLGELKDILKRNYGDDNRVKLLDDLMETAKEAAELGDKSKGRIVTMEELASSIRDGRARIERDRNRC